MAGREEFPQRYGPYDLLERIGEGGMAEVFRARLPGAQGFEKILVIKRILPHLARNEHFVRMFVNEAKLAARIHHPNVVQVFELGQTESGELFMAMEYIQGTDLRGVLRSAAQLRLRIPLWWTVTTVKDVLGGLSYAHEMTDDAGDPLQVVHRDVTPSNVFISDTGAVKLADFGIAKVSGLAQETEHGQLKGKTSYMPPEQLHGLPLDGRADVFSTGVILWECLAQRRLFGGRPDFDAMLAICEGEREPPSRYNPRVPPELDALVLAALEADRDQRIPSARDFQAGLLEVLPRLRARILPSEFRHVLEVLLARKDPDPTFGADLPTEERSYFVPGLLEPPPVSFDTTSAITNHPLAPAPTPAVLPEPSGAYGPDAFALAYGYGGPPPLPMAPYAPPPHGIPPAATPRPGPFPFGDPGITGPGAPPDPVFGSSAALPAITQEMFAYGTGSAHRPPSATTAGPPTRPSDPPPQAGAYGLYVRRGSTTVGPVPLRDVVQLCDPKLGRAEGVSVDGVRWVSVSRFAELTGLDVLTPDNAPLKKVTLVGGLENNDLIGLFLKLSRAKATGRIVLMQKGGERTARREIDVLKGAPTFVYTDRSDLQLPEFLLQGGILKPSALPELVHQAVAAERRLDELVPSRPGRGAGGIRASMMRARLGEVFRWRQGKFAFDQEALPRTTSPFASSLLAVLFSAVSAAYSTEELASELEHWRTIQLKTREGFEDVLTALELNEAVLMAAHRLGDGWTLDKLLKANSSMGHNLFVLYFLLLNLQVISD